MAKERTVRRTKILAADQLPQVAATLAGIVYQARLFNRQARMNVPEQSVISEVVNLWHTISDALARRVT